MPSRDPSDLDPLMQAILPGFIEACSQAGHPVTVYCTYRSDDEQTFEYSKGRTFPGPGTTESAPLGHTVTQAQAGQSPHNCRRGGAPASLAWDCGPAVGRTIWWDAPPTVWLKIGEIGEGMGLEWGGRFPKYDGPHFQASDWKDKRG